MKLVDLGNKIIKIADNVNVYPAYDKELKLKGNKEYGFWVALATPFAEVSIFDNNVVYEWYDGDDTEMATESHIDICKIADWLVKHINVVKEF